MNLYKYTTLGQLNEALGKFEEEGIKIAKVKLLTHNGMILYFILTDDRNNYQPNETKTNVG